MDVCNSPNEKNILSLLGYLEDKGNMFFSADKSIKVLLLADEIEEEKMDQKYTYVEFYRMNYKTE